jgi:hypothetical protein
MLPHFRVVLLLVTLALPSPLAVAFIPPSPGEK